MAKKISAEVMSLTYGDEHFHEIQAITIKSKEYNLMILEDYLPVIGDIDGDVIIHMEESNKTYKDIKGCYIHFKNHFKLMIINYD